MEQNTFKFSVIIPVYDVEAYLEETIESITKQTIGFKKNIQIILVNDGSPDRSEDICLKYREKYPDNIVYVKQENAGVSAARNKGMEYIQGKYVNFLDSDDKWSKNTFKEVYRFFEEQGEEIDIVAGRIKYFEKKDNYHVLDYKFSEKKKVVNILEDYSYIQLSIATTFVRAEALKGKAFDTRIKYGEDCILVNTILLDKCKYGLLRDCVYFYRMRDVGTSAMQNNLRTKSWYFETEQLVFKKLLEMSKEKFGRVINYVQYLVMYDTKWRLRIPVSRGAEVLSEEEMKEYYQIVVDIMQDIDEQIIVEQRDCTSWHYKLALDVKYQKDVNSMCSFDKGLICFGDVRLTHIARRGFTSIEFIDIKEDKLQIMGFAKYWLNPSDYKIAFVDQEENKYYVEFFAYPHTKLNGINGVYKEDRAFKVELPIENIKCLRAVFEYKEDDCCNMLLGFGKFSKLTTHMKNTYAVYGKYIVKYKNKKIFIQKNTKARYKRAKKEYNRELLLTGAWKPLFYLTAARLLKKVKSKKVWLLSDRINIARDNGEALFKYLSTVDTKDISPYFVISKDSEDYSRIKKYGKVIKYDSLKYRLYFLIADKIISAHIDEYVINAFGVEQYNYRNFMNADTVFLQHGITKDDLSGWVNKFNKDIAMFVTAAQPEYQSILDGEYYYTENEVKLTGFPRFDALVPDKRKKQIIFLPTWRKSLANPYNVKTGMREYSPAFKKTDFYQFYQHLISDERVLACMRKHGYTGKFCLHINHMEQIEDFKGNDVIKIHRGNLDYQKEFIENALMITDYSSVAFDFAYMKKEVIYAQFDREEFFEGQTYNEGYFDYEEDGFGPVCYEYEDAVQNLIALIEQDCKMQEKYEERIQRFYYKTDRENSKRVYEAILAIDKNS